LDIFGHKIHDKIGIYGSVPLLLAHKPNRTSGIFWLNSSETLVDISRKAVAEVSCLLSSEFNNERKHSRAGPTGTWQHYWRFIFCCLMKNCQSLPPVLPTAKFIVLNQKKKNKEMTSFKSQVIEPVS